MDADTKKEHLEAWLKADKALAEFLVEFPGVDSEMGARIQQVRANVEWWNQKVLSDTTP